MQTNPLQNLRSSLPVNHFQEKSGAIELDTDCSSTPRGKKYMASHYQAASEMKSSKIMSQRSHNWANLERKTSEPTITEKYPFNTKRLKMIDFAQELPMSFPIVVTEKGLNLKNQTMKHFLSVNDYDNMKEELKKPDTHQLIDKHANIGQVQNLLRIASNSYERKKNNGTMFVNELWGRKYHQSVIHATGLSRSKQMLKAKFLDTAQNRIEKLDQYYEQKHKEANQKERLLIEKCLVSDDDQNKEHLLDEKLYIYHNQNKEHHNSKAKSPNPVVSSTKSYFYQARTPSSKKEDSICDNENQKLQSLCTKSSSGIIAKQPKDKRPRSTTIEIFKTSSVKARKNKIKGRLMNLDLDALDSKRTQDQELEATPFTAHPGPKESISSSKSTYLLQSLNRKSSNFVSKSGIQPDQIDMQRKGKAIAASSNIPIHEKHITKRSDQPDKVNFKQKSECLTKELQRVLHTMHDQKSKRISQGRGILKLPQTERMYTSPEKDDVHKNFEVLTSPSSKTLTQPEERQSRLTQRALFYPKSNYSLSENASSNSPSKQSKVSKSHMYSLQEDFDKLLKSCEDTHQNKEINEHLTKAKKYEGSLFSTARERTKIKIKDDKKEELAKSLKKTISKNAEQQASPTLTLAINKFKPYKIGSAFGNFIND